MAEQLSPLQLQLRYYFSCTNLLKDSFLVQQFDFEGWCDIALIANFNKVKGLTQDLDVVREAFRTLPTVEVDPSGNRVRSRDWDLLSAYGTVSCKTTRTDEEMFSDFGMQLPTRRVLFDITLIAAGAVVEQVLIKMQALPDLYTDVHQLIVFHDIAMRGFAQSGGFMPQPQMGYGVRPMMPWGFPPTMLPQQFAPQPYNMYYPHQAYPQMQQPSTRPRHQGDRRGRGPNHRHHGHNHHRQNRSKSHEEKSTRQQHQAQPRAPTPKLEEASFPPLPTTTPNPNKPSVKYSDTQMSEIVKKTPPSTGNKTMAVDAEVNKEVVKEKVSAETNGQPHPPPLDANMTEMTEKMDAQSLSEPSSPTRPVYHQPPRSREAPFSFADALKRKKEAQAPKPPSPDANKKKQETQPKQETDAN